MPEISRFLGIVIKMFFDDHNPPHFHAEYDGDVALIDIRNLSVFSGRLPPRVIGLVIEWASVCLREIAMKKVIFLSSHPSGSGILAASRIRNDRKMEVIGYSADNVRKTVLRCRRNIQACVYRKMAQDSIETFSVRDRVWGYG